MIGFFSVITSSKPVRVPQLPQVIYTSADSSLKLILNDKSFLLPHLPHMICNGGFIQLLIVIYFWLPIQFNKDTNKECYNLTFIIFYCKFYEFFCYWFTCSSFRPVSLAYSSLLISTVFTFPQEKIKNRPVILINFFIFFYF